MIQQIFDFLTQPGNSDRIVGLTLAFIVVLGILSILLYHVMVILFDFFKSFLKLFRITINKNERIVEVPKYITPPENKEISKYLSVLKKIVDDYDNGIKLT